MPFTGHCPWDLDCTCQDCLEDPIGEYDEHHQRKPKYKKKEKATEKQFRAKYENKDPSIGSLSRPGKYEFLVWNLKSRSVACDLQWKSNITAFSVINGSSFMYVGDEYGTISVLKFCVENRELLQLPYQILWSSLSEAAGFANSDHQPVVGILPQPFTSGNRLLIAYESGLIILWDVVEAHVIIVKGDKDLHLKDGAVNFKKNADSSSPD
ncbi:hypothetical protein A4A49_24385, partial [Nicotiana attenuata]